MHPSFCITYIYCLYNYAGLVTVIAILSTWTKCVSFTRVYRSKQHLILSAAAVLGT